MDFIKPMRPGFKSMPGIWPKGWLWQLKVDEERGILADGRLYNRHGDLVAPHKQTTFEVACRQARKLFANVTLDVGMMGYRDTQRLPEFYRGCLIVFDLPTVQKPLEQRLALLNDLFQFPGPLFGATLFRLESFTDPQSAFEFSQEVPGCEGIIGRRPGSLYMSGDSRDMTKCRWR